MNKPSDWSECIWSAPSVGRAFSPLDEELALVAGQLTPLLAESLVRLGTWLPFAPAAAMLAFFTQTRVSAKSARRATEAAGTAAVALLEQTAQQPTAQRPIQADEQPTHLAVGVDGAFVPVVGGEWVEVKTVSIGVVAPAVLEGGEWVVHTQDLSYCSSLNDVDTFIPLAQVELARRRVADAAQLVGLSDGAAWIQRLLDRCCPAALRILDFPHAVSYLAAAGEAFFRDEPSAGAAWLAAQRQQLKSGRPQAVVAELHRLALLAYDQDATAAIQETIATAHDYLKARLPMLDYAQFTTQGHPIGTGASESANKLVVQRRLKGAGMHWQRANINPMLALLNTAANQRWDENWPATVAHRRTTRRLRLLARHATPLPPAPPPPPPPEKAPARPAKDHPWRRFRLSPARPRAVA
jgi:hypothetical protein